MLMRCPLGFSPQSPLEDLLWKQRTNNQPDVEETVPAKASVVVLKDRKELVS